jgi:CSLREA domain-containing protein
MSPLRPHPRASVCAALLSAVLAALVAAPAASAGVVLQVNSISDTSDGLCDVANCTLRDAIEASNATPSDADTISFDIGGAGPHRILVGTALPAFTDTAFIDGTSEPGFDPVARQPVIEVVGPGPGAGVAVGLNLTIPNSSIQALAIGGFDTGIVLAGGGFNGIVESHVGTDASGTVAIPNGTGISAQADAPSNSIGSSVLSGNTGAALVLASDFNNVQGSQIGTNAGGTAPLPNGTGVAISGSSNSIEGRGQRNVISGNTSSGIAISGSNNVVYGNSIGTDTTGAADLGNGGYGVQLLGATAVGNVVGDYFGSGTANLIAFNDLGGVRVEAGHQARVNENSMYSNDGLGIDIGAPGVTANDAGDRDGIPNFPVLTAAVVTPTDGTTFEGSLDGSADGVYSIDLFSSPSCDPSGFGEGRRYLDRFEVQSDPAGDAALNHLSAVTVPAGQAITATSTGPGLQTSEFSRCITATTERPVDPLPAPVQGETVNVAPVSGVVRVRVPGGRFVLLRAGQQIPIGSLVDTTGGIVRLTSAAGATGETQTATFREGVFKTAQKRARKAFTELKLAGPLKGCAKRSATTARKRRGRHLWGDGYGKFRTVGNKASAGVRGTKWLVEDRCDRSTLVAVKRGHVAVRDFVKRRTIQLKAGQRYVARPRGAR